MPDLKATHSELCNKHRESGENYSEIRSAALSAFQDLLDADDRARRALKESGVDALEPRSSLAVDWYSDEQSYREHGISDADSSGVWVSGGVAALTGSIGVQLGAWTVTGGFGKELTGAAKWFGIGSIPVGGLELAVAPLVLSCICLVTGVVMLVAATMMTRHRNRRVGRDMGDANTDMERALERMEVNGARLRELANDAKDVAFDLSRATGAFQANRNQLTVDHVHTVLSGAERLYSRAQEPLPYARLHVDRPSPLDSLTAIEATMSSVTIRWEDPDLGNTEVESYRVRHGGGFLRGEKDLMTVNETEFIHTELEPGKTYTYRIIPVNKRGEAASNRTFEARTQEA